MIDSDPRNGTGGPSRKTGPPAPHHIRLLAALDAVEGLGPGLVVDAGPAVAAILDRRLPEVDLVEQVGAIGGAALIAEDRLALARGRHRRDTAEPRGDAGLGRGRERMLQPHIGAVRMRR